MASAVAYVPRGRSREDGGGQYCVVLLHRAALAIALLLTVSLLVVGGAIENGLQGARLASDQQFDLTAAA